MTCSMIKKNSVVSGVVVFLGESFVIDNLAPQRFYNRVRKIVLLQSRDIGSEIRVPVCQSSSC